MDNKINTLKIHQNTSKCLVILVKCLIIPRKCNPTFEHSLTVRDKIACQTHLERENDCFKHIFEILNKFTIQ